MMHLTRPMLNICGLQVSVNPYGGSACLCVRRCVVLWIISASGPNSRVLLASSKMTLISLISYNGIFKILPILVDSETVLGKLAYGFGFWCVFNVLFNYVSCLTTHPGTVPPEFVSPPLLFCCCCCCWL